MNKNMYRHLIISNLIGIIIILSFFLNNKSILLVGLISIAICIGITRIENKGTYLLFFISWTYVLKLSPNSISFTTIYILIFLISYILMYKNIKINKKIFLCFILFSIYHFFILFVNQNNNFIQLLGMISIYLSLYLLVNFKQYNTNLYFFSYINGVMLSGIAGIFIKYMPQIHIYINSYSILKNNELTYRLSGFDNDPNYFAVHILLSITLLLIIYRRTLDIKLLVPIFILIGLGFMTVSKMLLIILSFILIPIIIQMFKSKNKFFILTLVGSVIILLGPYAIETISNLYLARLGDNLNNIEIGDLTTGRLDLWIMYMDTIFNDYKIFLFGKGLNNTTLNGYGAHNLYLYAWYVSGIIGIILLIIYLKQIYREIGFWNKKKNIIGFLPLIIILVCGFSLDMYTFDYFPYQLLLAMLALKY